MNILLVTLVTVVVIMFIDLFRLERNKQEAPLSVQIMYSGFIATLLVCIANAA